MFQRLIVVFKFYDVIAEVFVAQFRLNGHQTIDFIFVGGVFAQNGPHQRFFIAFDVDGNDYEVDGVQFVFNVHSGVERIDIDRVNVYPNPATSYINVSGAVEHLTLYDMQGALVLEATTNTLDVTAIPVGNYLLKVKDSDGVRSVKVLIVR